MTAKSIIQVRAQRVAKVSVIIQWPEHALDKETEAEKC